MYRIRFFAMMVQSIFLSPRGLLEVYELRFIAVPLIDTDLSRLFTQAYSAFMALGRWNYVFASPMKSVALKKAWVPVTTRESTQYRRSIRAGSRLTLKTSLVFWNDKRFYLKQVFISEGQVACISFVEGLLRSPTGILNPVDVFMELGNHIVSPIEPDEIRLWRASFL